MSHAIALPFSMDSISMMYKQGEENQTGHSNFNESSRLRPMDIMWQGSREEGIRNKITLESSLKSLLNTKKCMCRVRVHKSEHV